MDEATKENLSNRNIWARILYMLLFGITYSISETVLIFVAIFQALAVLFTGHVNQALHQFGANLSGYMYQILQFVTFNTEDLPFPFNDWPEQTVGETPYSESENETSPIVDNADAHESESADQNIEQGADIAARIDADLTDTNSDAAADNDEEDPNKPAL